jgi:hypothetical protein
MTRGIVVWIFWGCQKIDSVVTGLIFTVSTNVQPREYHSSIR